MTENFELPSEFSSGKYALTEEFFTESIGAGDFFAALILTVLI